MGWDLAVIDAIAEHRTAWLTELTRMVMTVGMSRLTYLAAFVLCVLFALLFRAWRPAVAAPIAAVIGIYVADVGKDWIGRARPPSGLALVQTGGFAMPSSIGAMTAAAAMPIILFGLRRETRTGRLLALAVIAATLVVGVSMVYLGAHWASDVLAGWALGAAIGAATLYGIELLTRRRAPAT